MTKEIKLEAELRGEKNNNVKNMRDAGFVPANVYGAGVKNRNIKVKEIDFERVFNVAGESNLIDLSISKGETVKVIVKDLQKNPVKDNVIHIDFYQVDMNKKIITEIPLNFTGEPKAVKELGGTLIKNMNSLEVKCLPGDLIDKIDVDLSNLNNFHDAVRANEIKLPESMELTGGTNETVVTVIEPLKEEEEEKKEEVAPEDEGGEKKEGEDAEKAEGVKEGEKQGEKK